MVDFLPKYIFSLRIILLYIELFFCVANLYHCVVFFSAAKIANTAICPTISAHSMALAFRFASHCGSVNAFGAGHVLRRTLTGSARQALDQSAAKARAVAEAESSAFWTRNKRLNRPWSPHMTIYKPQITWILSLAHRTTGVMMTTGWVFLGLGALLYSGKAGDFELAMVQLQKAAFGSAVIMGAKLLSVGP